MDVATTDPRLADLRFDNLWKADWADARTGYIEWWEHRGLAVHITAPRDTPIQEIGEPEKPADIASVWLDPHYRIQSALADISRTFYGGIAYPNLSVDIGPGSLGLFLGAQGRLAETTVWYESCLDDYETHPALQFDPAEAWFRRHVALIEEAIAQSEGRYLREIKAGGKSVQAIRVAYDEVEPLIDAVGPEGLYIMTSADGEADARALLSRLRWRGDC